jgi:UDP-N-acetyl-D-galactosamine dehydrogenase
VTVPTPIDSNNIPDLTPLIEASRMLGEIIKKEDVVIYESTVYPGVTEEVCIPVIEDISGLRFNEEFYAGYSPERINPGDKTRKFRDIVKITSGSTPEIANLVDDLYKSVVVAGTHKAPSIAVAEAAKVIENVQRDVNIALINEFFQIFTKLGIDTMDVIEAASTKWNFLKLTPGLVGGHCISVDPYYLKAKAESAGYTPDLIRVAREINNGMPAIVVSNFIKALIKKKFNLANCKILILGYTFKPDCPDTRNTKVQDIYEELIQLGLNVSIHDPYINDKNLSNHVTADQIKEFDIAFLAVKHQEFLFSIENIKQELKQELIYDFQKNKFL